MRTGIPVQECFAPEHGCELLVCSLEKLLHRCRVADERRAERSDRARNVTKRDRSVVWDPLDKVVGIAVLNVRHGLLDFPRAQVATAEVRRAGQIAPKPRVNGRHRVVGREELKKSALNVTKQQPED